MLSEWDLWCNVSSKLYSKPEKLEVPGGETYVTELLQKTNHFAYFNGLSELIDYGVVIEALKQHYAPLENEFEWQYLLQTHTKQDN